MGDGVYEEKEKDGKVWMVGWMEERVGEVVCS